MIALSVAVENFFPPSPSDIFVVLAAFLSNQGNTMHPVTVFLVAWGFGVAGAVLVYWASRRFGRRFFEGRLGRRLITPGAFASIEKVYLRFGVVGIFLFRMLPAFRAVVAPFAGLVNLSPARTLIPITLACAVWYGGLTFLGHELGYNWGAIQSTLKNLNRGMGIAAAVVLVALTVWFLRRRKAGKERREELKPFDPHNPDQPAELEGGLPRISVEELDEVRRARRREEDGE